MHVAIVKCGVAAGGGARVMESWARVLARAGHRTAVFAEDDPASRDALQEIPGVERHFYPPPAWPGRPVRAWLAPRAAVEAVARRHGERPLDLILGHDSLTSPAFRASLPRVALLQTFHSPSVEENRLNNWRYAPSLWRRLTYPVTFGLLWRQDRAAIQAISWAHTLSDYTWTLLSARYPGPCRNVGWSRVPGSFAEQRFVPPADRETVRRALGFAADERVLLTVRRLVPRNAVERILDCAVRLRSAYPRARYVIGGTGPQQAQLAERVQREGLAGTVRLAGFMPEAELAGYYQAADAFLLPTRDLECFGLPVIEAMACGTTPLVTPIGGPAEILARSHPDCVASANSSAAFSELVEAFLAGRIAPRRAELAAEARRRFSEAALEPLILETLERAVAAERGRR